MRALRILVNWAFMCMPSILIVAALILVGDRKELSDPVLTGKRWIWD